MRCQVLDLGGHFDQLLTLLTKSKRKAKPKLHQDLMRRLRMAVLHYFGELHQYLIVGSLSQCSWDAGDFTRYGDGDADLFPLTHLSPAVLQDMAGALGLPAELFELRSADYPLRHPRQQDSLAPEMVEAYLAGTSAVALDHFPRASRSHRPHVAAGHTTSYHFSSSIRTADRDLADIEDHEAYGKSIEALTLISKAITSDQYLEDILRLIVMVTAEVMNSSVCSLWLLDDKESVLRLRATQSIDREYLKDRVLKVGEGVVGKVVAENRPYAVGDVLADPYFKEKELARRMRLVSMLSMPMRVKDRVIGVINCYTSHPHVFSDLQTNVLTAVANQAAVAIEKTELMVQTRVIQEELEKRKLIERAKDLLVKRLSIPGEEAYRWLQKRSMNTRKSMREVAEAVILTMES
jgi:putative methionine-R-sulfoxide reductase with GAF domain